MTLQQTQEAVQAAGGIYYEISGKRTEPGLTCGISVYPRQDQSQADLFEFGNSFTTADQACAAVARSWHKGVADGLRRAKEIRHG